MANYIAIDDATGNVISANSSPGAVSLFAGCAPDAKSFCVAFDGLQIQIFNSTPLQAGQTYSSTSTSLAVVSDVRCGTDGAGTASMQLDQFAVQPPSTAPTTIALQFICDDGVTTYSGSVAYNVLPTTPGAGYYQFDSFGNTYGFGNDSYLTYLGNPSYLNLSAPIVSMATTPDEEGYWMTGGDGGVFAYGDAGFYGSTGNIHLNQPIVGMAATPSGKGYWFVASDGGVFAYGDAQFYGSMGARPLNQPIVGMAATPTGKGYWLVAADGGIFAFGDARFYGSTGNIHLNQPIVGMTATSTGKGYWFVASDGGVFSYGDAVFHGSTGGIRLNEPVTGMLAAPGDKGYWLVADDGGLFSFDAPFYGSLGGQGFSGIVGMVR